MSNGVFLNDDFVYFLVLGQKLLIFRTHKNINNIIRRNLFAVYFHSIQVHVWELPYSF